MVTARMCSYLDLRRSRDEYVYGRVEECERSRKRARMCLQRMHEDARKNGRMCTRMQNCAVAMYDSAGLYSLGHDEWYHGACLTISFSQAMSGELASHNTYANIVHNKANIDYCIQQFKFVSSRIKCIKL